MLPSKDDPPSGTSTSKIAIKGFSLSAKSKTSTSKPNGKLPLASALGKRPRSTFGVRDDSDSDDDKHAKHEAVTAFGESGAVKKHEKIAAGPLVIPKVANRDWKSEARARRGGAVGKNLLPPEVQAAQEAARREREGVGKEGEERKEGVDVVNGNDGEIVWGLSVRKKEKVEEGGEGLNGGGQDTDAGHGKAEIQPEVATEEEPKKEKTADEEALEALLGAQPVKKGPDLIIPTVTSQHAPVSELDAYKRAIAIAPDVSTLEDYERVPVEEFGAALLRGMGWDGKLEKSTKEVKRRQNLLGLGATELKDAEELGAWVQKSDVKRLKSGAGDRRPERAPKASEYKREEEKRRERRLERGGGSYRQDRERERDDRNGRGYGDRDRDRDAGRDRRR